jgi:sphingosine kinase
VLVNPVSGKKKGPQIWAEALTLLANAHVTLQVITTEHADHGTEIVRDLDPATVDGIVAVGGDGLLYEVMQGIFARSDAAAFLTRVPLGIIAAGTANALATTMGALRPLDAAMHLAQRRFQPLDLWDVTLSGKRFIAFCIFTWGLMSSATKNAEGYRWMGGPRYKFAGVLEMFKNQKHRVTVDYVPAPEDAGLFRCEHSGPCEHCGPSYTAVSDIPPKVATAPAYPDEQWVTVEGDFEIVLGTNLTHISYDILSSPFAHYADGFMDMQLVKPQGFFSNVKLMGKIKTGTHLNPDIQYTKVRALRLTPRDDGIPVNVDGEIYECAVNDPVTLTVMPSAATIMFSP